MTEQSAGAAGAEAQSISNNFRDDSNRHLLKGNAWNLRDTTLVSETSLSCL
jgi:hypothetical protein